MDELLAVNRTHWDEVTDVHMGSDYYDVESFKAGENRLHGCFTCSVTSGSTRWGGPGWARR
jgi:hypothetical protein